MRREIRQQALDLAVSSCPGRRILSGTISPGGHVPETESDLVVTPHPRIFTSYDTVDTASRALRA